MDYSKLKWCCPHCDRKDNHKRVLGIGVDSRFLVYRCGFCQELFKIIDSCCGSYTAEIPFNGKVEEDKEQHDKSAI
tara:strand:- start:143 stop:370 length:228 start_codon:yes stop_codon:yes gene_type:complete